GGGAGGGSAGNGAGGSAESAGEGGESGQLDGPTLYVDPITGDDTQPGTREEPLRTIAHAASLARSGSEIILLDGTYDKSTQPQFESPLFSACGVDSGVVIPSGVTLRADHSGAARLSIAGYHGLCASSGRIEGLRLERLAPGPHVLECDHGELAIHETSFENVGFVAEPGSMPEDPEYPTGLLLSGSAHVALTPGNLPEYLLGTSTRFANVRDQATLTITGGSLTVSEDPHLTTNYAEIALRVSGSASLTLHALQLTRSAGSSTLDGSGMFLTNSVQVRLDQGTTVTGFGEGIVGTGGDYQVSLDGVQFTDNGTALLAFSPGDVRRKRLDISSSIFTRHARGVYAYAVDADLTIRDSVFTEQSSAAIEFAASGTATLDGVTATHNGYGLVLAAWNAQLDFQINVRNSQFSSNAGDGVWASTNGKGLVDLGSVAAPGNNTFQGNGWSMPDTANLQFGSSLPLPVGTVLAVGNTWDANVQGADPAGRYSVVGAGAQLEVLDGAGPNYRLITSNDGILRLAENP
ncbi:MAG: right-handed parallel beta-helix repeat-containing protein, partial [Polyangiaceae bacterium]